MGNLRQKYTEEEWDELQESSKKRTDFQRDRKEEERNSKTELCNKIEEFELILRQELNNGKYISDSYNFNNLLELYKEHFNLRT